MIRLCAFLGNYGREYKSNRHNAAWQWMEYVPCVRAAAWKRGFHGHWAEIACRTENETLRVIMPETYMNLSGDSVADLARFYKIPTEEILVVHDELELPFGFFGFKRGGGLGGHNGLRSIKDRLGSPDFMRLRFGIGRPPHDDIAAYVLSDFSASEREALACSIFPKAAEAFMLCLEHGFDETLARYAKYNALAQH